MSVCRTSTAQLSGRLKSTSEGTGGSSRTSPMQASVSPEQALRCRPGSGESDTSIFPTNGTALRVPPLTTLSPSNSAVWSTSSMHSSPVSTAESKKEPARGRTGPMQELMDTKRQLRAQQAVNKKLQEQVVSYEKEVEALRSNFSVSQSQASVAKVSTEINSKAMGSLCHEVAKLQADRAQLEELLAQDDHELRELYAEREQLQTQLDAFNAEITELRGAQAESECKSKALSEELQAAKEALRRRDASLQRNQCDQQAAHAEICALQKSCDSLKATLKHMHAAHIAAEREVASLQQIRLDQEQELQAEIAALLARLECQAQEAAQLQRHREQARELTADLQTTTHALEASQARLQETAHTLQHTLQQLTQAEERLEAAKATNLALQEVQSHKQSSLVFRLIRGGLSILAAALAAQQVSNHMGDRQAADKREKAGIRVLNWRISVSNA
ncbi:hypothetical protein CVIRNUC_002945 [Coccomyxa viridis]|uniref:Uncharacterized protein n=1 Tax=Coccomyxa viridis TaxID=1274662 RepID=A0AAV1HZV4_9CHLO|nr:hypothetical protein CVIRNUC_002945 [Coccomyxa viridis]